MTPKPTSIIKVAVEYHDDGTLLEAFVANPELAESDQSSKKPTVLVFPAWRGRDAFACEKAEALAKLGYVGIALDVYGKGVSGKNREECTQLVQPFMEDRLKLRQRLLAGLETALKLPYVNPNQIAAMGFCFGGLCALDLARSGADIKGVVTFHGSLKPLSKIKNEKIKSKILVLHGHDDPTILPSMVLDFENEMTEAQADWQVHTYGNTMHAFTLPTANEHKFGTAYQPSSDRRSWIAMKNFFEEIFAD